MKCNLFKNLFFCTLLIFHYSSRVYSQHSDKVVAKAYYTLAHKRDLSKDTTYKENMVLLLGASCSVFKSHDRVLQAEMVRKNLNEQEKNWTGAGLPRTKMPTDLRKITTEEIFLFQQEKKFIITEYLLANYLYEDTIELINWDLKADKKLIGKINCQKATAKYKGRDWVAWFSQEIPFESGPWKLYGLPGLIIEAYDTKMEIQFLFSGFESNLGENTPVNQISVPKKTISITKNELKKLKENMYKNPRGFWEAQTILSRGIVDPEQLAGFNPKEIINPIEIPMKK